jgi:hypothetical protein
MLVAVVAVRLVPALAVQGVAVQALELRRVRLELQI